MIIIFFTLFCILLERSYQLTAQQVSNFCHCDLTSSYCDFDCCCDLDCSSTINSTCFLAKSSTFCLNSTYYYKIDSTLTPSDTNTGCYYYNSSTTLQEQVNLTTQQMNQIAANGKQTVSLAIQMYRGFKLGDVLNISGTSQFSFMDASGNCLNVGGSSGFNIQIGWRLNSDIVCSGSSNSIKLFNDMIGKSIYAFQLATNNLVIIPEPTTTYNDVTVYIIIGRYGSANIEYIQAIKTIGIINSNTNTRALRFRFVDPQTDVQQQEASPSFFPQIPYDIFYPIYQIAYSF